MNCAVAIVSGAVRSPLHTEPWGTQKTQEAIRSWRDWFYYELSKDYPEASTEFDEQEGRAEEAREADTDANIHRHDDLPGSNRDS